MSIQPFAATSPIAYTQSASVEEIRREIETIDLSMVKLKLMDEDEGQGWTQEYVDHVEIRYRRYLIMLRVSPSGDAVPTRDIDLFWHQHILDTRAYANDCQRVFGEFIHHFPYFGMRGEEDAQNLQYSFEETKTRYASLFGEDYCEQNGPLEATTCHKGPGNCHKCKSGCGMKCTQCKSR
jgi:hypothetical protein